MGVKDDLIAARDHLLTHGWMKGRPGQAGEPCCALGAIIAVCGGVPDSRRASRALREALPSWAGGNIPDANDALSTTIDDVIGWFNTAIEAQN